MIAITPIILSDITQKRVDRFWSRVNKTETCWLWVASIDKDGYGKFWMRVKEYRASRLAYYFRHKIDPFPYLVLHICDTPTCVNPKHLYLGTPHNNMQDMENRGRGINSNAKLSITDVKKIKELLASHTQHELADMFNVKLLTINRIACKRTWWYV